MMKKPSAKSSMEFKRFSTRGQDLASYLEQHQIELPLKVMAVIVSGYFLRLPIFKYFLFISNERSDGRYEKSLWDISFLLFYICVFTGLRAAIMNHVLLPLAKYTQVPSNKHQRFTEQAWYFLYYTASFGFGIYVMYDSPWWFDSTYFWRDYPVTDFTKSFKYYYLLQFAFWLQQLFVLKIEAPRNDYTELVLHHINTLLLISLSYCCNYTRVGNAVFVCMDLPDAFLGLAKLLNYALPGPVCNTVFAVTFVSWIYTRVYLYGGIIISTYSEPELYVPKFVLDPANGQWFPHFAKYIILGLMIGLYCLVLFWTTMFLKVFYKIVFTPDDAKDVRSDDEDDIAIENIEGDHSTLKATAKDIRPKAQ